MCLCQRDVSSNRTSVGADSSRTSAAPDVHLQLFPSVQEGLKACAQPTDQPSV
jgi:hypothetical protein